jgi:hypothetical protein
VLKDEDTYAAPTEFLNTLEPSGIPKHRLELKRNMPIMLLRNLSPAEGLCNGTRLLVHRVINDRLLEAEIATGSTAATSSSSLESSSLPTTTSFHSSGRAVNSR